jgi:curved DNA-binding protein CbpA
MNGQLSEQPLAELIREISSKSLGGRLRLTHERVKVAAYFDNGNFVYAASNVRGHRLREYLQKSNLVSDQDLAQFKDRVSDPDLVKVLCAQKLLSSEAAEQVQTRLASDVLCMALLWTEGTWEFDSRSRLNEQLNLKIDATSLLLDTGRRLPKQFAASRFPDPAELIAPLGEPRVHENLLPAEGFLLSRLDRPATVNDLVSLTGLGEAETLHIIYSLALAGLIKREHWKSAFSDQQPRVPQIVVEETPTPSREEVRDNEIDLNEVESFLQRVKNAQTHYDVLSVGTDIPAQDVKNVYYELARRYHPDRFRKAAPALVPRLESAFARITQAYDTLQDDGLRASYNSKLVHRKKAEQLADSAPKAATAAPQADPVAEGVAQPVISVAERAESQFKEGFAALELGERKVAIGLFASAASAMPNEPRYRAFYGHMLAANESTRRAAEGHLQAAVKLEPGNAEYRVMLAELYRDLGLKLRAKGEAERAVAADPNNRKARDLLRALK